MSELLDAFSLLRRALKEHGCEFAVGGSWASGTYSAGRATVDLDLLVRMTPQQAAGIAVSLAPEFYSDEEQAAEAVRSGRAFNAIHLSSAYKFDLFPAHTEWNAQELLRSKPRVVPALSAEPVLTVSAEDIVLAKLQWFRSGGERSDRQWNDVLGVVSTQELDVAYLHEWAGRLGVGDLLRRALDQGRSSESE